MGVRALHAMLCIDNVSSSASMSHPNPDPNPNPKLNPDPNANPVQTTVQVDASEVEYEAD